MPTADLRGANLREAGLGEVDWERADLRAANLRGDFYLVDLREARLDPNQLEHVRRCGAILEEMDQEC